MLNILIALLSLVLLIKSSSIFIDQSTSLAKKIHVSSFLIGFTLIAVGTSLPDLVISTYSTLQQHSEIAISTLLGSALVKISMVLGILALFTKYKLSSIDIKRNIPINFVILVIFFLLLLIFNFQMTWIMGIITIAIFVVSTYLAQKNNHKIEIKSKNKFNILILIISFLVLIISGKLCVDNVVAFANTYNIAKTTAGYFILAIGTSIPEFVTSITTIKKNNLQLGLGNILGSSLIDLLFASGICSFISTLDFKPFTEDLLYLMFATILFLLFAILGKKYYLSRKEGVGLIFVYLIFILLQRLGI